MEHHNQLQMYVGLNEGGCQDVATIKLDGFTLVSTADLIATERKVNTLAEQVRQLTTLCLAYESEVPFPPLTKELLGPALEARAVVAELKAEAVSEFAKDVLAEIGAATTYGHVIELLNKGVKS